MPPLKDDESAVTESRYECNVTLSYQVMSRKELGDSCTTLLKVRGVDVKLQLRIVIWIPDGATAKLSAHEEGHRQIAERVYEAAEEIARQIAATLDGKTIRGEGADCAEAEKRATADAADHFCKSYLDETARPSTRVNEIYDDLTAHGTRTDPVEDEAIRQAFEKANAH